MSTAASTAPLAGILDGLAPHGRLTVVGVDAAPLPIHLGQLVMHALGVTGHITGNPTDTEQAMRFALATGVRPWVRTLPLDRAAEALQAPKAGQARFRTVLLPGAEEVGNGAS